MSVILTMVLYCIQYSIYSYSQLVNLLIHISCDCFLSKTETIVGHHKVRQIASQLVLMHELYFADHFKFRLMGGHFATSSQLVCHHQHSVFIIQCILSAQAHIWSSIRPVRRRGFRGGSTEPLFLYLSLKLILCLNAKY